MHSSTSNENNSTSSLIHLSQLSCLLSCKSKQFLLPFPQRTFKFCYTGKQLPVVERFFMPYFSILTDLTKIHFFDILLQVIIFKTLPILGSFQSINFTTVSEEYRSPFFTPTCNKKVCVQFSATWTLVIFNCFPDQYQRICLLWRNIQTTSTQEFLVTAPERRRRNRIRSVDRQSNNSFAVLQTALGGGYTRWTQTAYLEVSTSNVNGVQALPHSEIFAIFEGKAIHK